MHCAEVVGVSDFSSVIIDEGASRRALRRSVDGHCANAGGSATSQMKDSLLWGRRPLGLSEPAAVCLGGTLDREPATGPDCAQPRQASSCPYQNARFEQPCSQVLHLEYRLDAVPSAGDSLSLQLGDRISRSRWTRP